MVLVHLQIHQLGFSRKDASHSGEQREQDPHSQISSRPSTNMHQTKQAANDKCPACIQLPETVWKILGCSSGSLVWGTELLCTLKETLTTHHTQLDLALIHLHKEFGVPSPTNTFIWITTIANLYSKPYSTPITASDGNIFSKVDLAIITGLRFRGKTHSRSLHGCEKDEK